VSDNVSLKFNQFFSRWGGWWCSGRASAVHCACHTFDSLPCKELGQVSCTPLPLHQVKVSK